MAHGLGLDAEDRRAGGPGLGLAAPTVLARPGAVPGQAPREVDTASAATRARATSQPKAQATQLKSRIPRFSEDPLRATAFALSEGALAFAGQPTNLGRLLQLESEDERAAQAQAFQDQGLKLRAASLGLDALETVATTLPKLRPEQMDAFISGLPEVPGIDIKAMATAAKDGQLEGLEATVAGLRADPDAMTFLSSMDLSNKSPAEVKALADKVLAFKIDAAGAEKKADLDVETAAAKQKALAAGKVQEAKDIAEAKAAAKGDKSALKEEDGTVKTAASSEIRRQSVLMHGGFIDPRTGETSGLTREAAQNAIEIAAEAERMIQAGKARSIAEATKKAAVKIGIPQVETPEIQIPESKREEFLVQNAEISFLLPMAQAVLGDVETSTGTLSNLAAFADATAGQIFAMFGAEDPVVFRDTQEARQNIRLFNQEVKRAVVNNPKFPKFEQDIVAGFLTDPNVYFENPATAVLNFKSLVDFLNRKLTTNSSLLQGKIPEGMKTPDTELSPEELQELEALRKAQSGG